MTFYDSHIKKNHLTISLITLFLLFWGLEVSDKLTYYFFPEFSFSQYIKAAVLIGFLFFQIAVKDYKFILIALVMCIVFSIGQIFLETTFSRNALLTFFKFLFPILLLAFINNRIQNYELTSGFFKTFEWVMVVNSILLLIGVLLSIKLFNTYQGNRFGYNGMFAAVSNGSYGYIITMFYFLLRYKERVIKNWKFILIFISCIFIGTKAVYLSMGFAIAYIVVVSKIPFKRTLLVAAILTGLLLAYYFFFQYGMFNSIRQSDGLLSALLSYRDQLFLERTLPFIQESWSWVNYLFGGVIDYDMRSQMDIVDVFFFWGIFGGAFYLFAFLRLFIPRKIDSTGWVFLSFFAFIVLLAGNFFVYSFVAIFLVVLKLIFHEKSLETSE